MTTQSLKGRIALVTGGTTGLGFGALNTAQQSISLAADRTCWTRQ
jgi:NAD(P)-dependent dehydrogenase (short-subunit alcohol dehydrogenase family)